LNPKVKDGKLPHGILKDATIQMPVGRRTVSDHWKKLRAKYVDHLTAKGLEDTMATMMALPDEFFATNKKNCGQNSAKHDVEAMAKAMEEIPLSKRQTVAQTALALGVPTASFHRLTKTEAIVKHSSALKPILTEENQFARVAYCLDQINKPPQHPVTRQQQAQANGTTPLKYQDQMDTIHVDEKWFHLTRDGARYYLSAAEKRPTRRTRHKSYIAKIMFFCAVARPRRLSDGTYWDGKIGMWPFGKYKPAQRKSKLRARGTMVWHNESCDGKTYKAMVLDNLMPAILAKWPDWSRPVRIQHDGAPGHFNEATDEEWKEFIVEFGLQGKLFFFHQPANSPDTNLCDLGLFRAIDAAYRRLLPRKEADIIACVLQAWQEYDATKINRLWLTHMTVMNEIIKSNGDNDFKIPHMGKERLERLGLLPEVIDTVPEAHGLLYPPVDS